ncbi:MAG TPA: DUF4142 domain-containing protein [Chitinolyticbacter sp.]|nr:DUF4142 domain-containing protein [Chitinolyticbacter sp.]
MRATVLLLLTLAAAIQLPIQAAPTTAITSTPAARIEPSGVRDVDQEFIAQAGASGLAEVEAGRLALKKSDSEGVKQLANMLIDDHTKANERLNTVAALKNLSLPREPTPQSRQHLAKLQKKSGKEFDDAYLRQQREGHEKAIALHRHQVQAGGDADLRQYAADTLPVIEGHLKHIQTLMQGTHAQHPE